VRGSVTRFKGGPAAVTPEVSHSEPGTTVPIAPKVAARCLVPPNLCYSHRTSQSAAQRGHPLDERIGVETINAYVLSECTCSPIDRRTTRTHPQPLKVRTFRSNIVHTALAVGAPLTVLPAPPTRNPALDLWNLWRSNLAKRRTPGPLGTVADAHGRRPWPRGSERSGPRT
jgi:hypothetical protein